MSMGVFGGLTFNLVGQGGILATCRIQGKGAGERAADWINQLANERLATQQASAKQVATRAPPPPADSVRSADNQWWWDGERWQPV